MLVEVPDSIVYVLQERALALELPLDVVVTAALASALHISGGRATPRPRETMAAAIGRMVDQGMCDADIAEETHYTVGYIAKIRRDLHKPANRRSPDWCIPH